MTAAERASLDGFLGRVAEGEGVRMTLAGTAAGDKAIAMRRETAIAAYLRERGFKRLFIAGLATDFCVNWTAVDARTAGFETFVIEDLTRAIDTNGSLAAAWNDMTLAGVRRINSTDIA